MTLVRSASLALVGLLVACGRPLDLPASPTGVAPHPTTVTPDAAFAGDVLTIRGSDLGTPAGTRVLVGGVLADVVAGAPAGTLTVAMPDGLAPGPLDVTVTRGSRSSSLTGAVRYLGPGEPASLTAQATWSLAPLPTGVDYDGDWGYLLDWRTSEAIQIDVASGLAVSPPLHVGRGPVLAFGTTDAEWIYSNGRGDARPRLVRADFTGDAPVVTCDSGELSTIGGSGFLSRAAMQPSVSADGALLAAPQYPSTLALIDTTSCPPTVRTVDLGEPIGSVAVDGRTVLVGLATHFALVTPSGEVVAGPELDPDAAPVDGGPLAVEPGKHRAAYVRADTDLGLVDWDDSDAPPALEPTIPLTFENVLGLAFDDPPSSGDVSDRLFATSATRVTEYDASGPGRLVGAGAFDEPVAPAGMAPLVPAYAGMMLVGIGHGTALASVDGLVVRQTDLAPENDWLTVGPDGRVLVGTFFGAEAIAPDFSTSTLTLGPDGVQREFDVIEKSGGEPVAYEGTELYRYDQSTRGWSSLGSVASGEEIVAAARDEDGTHTAAITVSSDERFHLERVAGPAPLTVDFPATPDAFLYFDEGTLYAALAIGADVELLRFDPDTLAMLGPPVKLDTPIADPEVEGLFWSRALDAPVVVVDDLPADVTGDGALRGAVYVTVDRDGNEERTPGLLPPSAGTPLALSPDGRLLASSSGTSLAFWRLERADGRLDVRPAGELSLPAPPTNAAFSADGASLYATLPATGQVVLVQ